MKVTGEGMPIFEGHGNGDLFIEFNVVLPERISPELRKSKYNRLFIHSALINHLSS
jgi:DnaJ-class molecular chaperone